MLFKIYLAQFFDRSSKRDHSNISNRGEEAEKIREGIAARFLKCV